MKKYQIIYADPPWKYNDKLSMKGVHGMIRGAESFYDTMSLSDIKNLQVKKITENDCILFIWTTMPLLRECLDVINSWGFKFKTCGFTWIKTTKNMKTHCGMGHYTRGNAELCLIGTKGKPKIINHSVRQVVHSNIEKHSQKPRLIRDQIVRLMGDISKIELFAREKVEGWDCWGNEVESDIDL